MNQLTNIQLVVFSLAILFTGMMVMHVIVDIQKRSKKSREAEAEAREKEHAERKLKQKRDHQLNHGRQIYNWLTDELKQYEVLGIKIWKMEENGGQFSMFIEDAGAGVPNLPILQLSYDFEWYKEPYQGHIHYGANGADILIWVGDHAPKNGLERLVLKEVREYADRIRQSRLATLEVVGSLS